jgi:hypothetical protein
LYTVLPAPTITGFSPTSGTLGTVVTITGTNLTGANVSFTSGKTATVTSNTDTQVVVQVPSGASTGTIGVSTTGGYASTSTFTVL